MDEFGALLEELDPVSDGFMDGIQGGSEVRRCRVNARQRRRVRCGIAIQLTVRLATARLRHAELRHVIESLADLRSSR